MKSPFCLTKQMDQTVSYLIRIFRHQLQSSQPNSSELHSTAKHTDACNTAFVSQILNTNRALKTFYLGKSPFLTIQFCPQFDFGHRTPKPDIFDHPTIKTVQI